MVKIRDRAIVWDTEITEARRTLNWDKQISLSINPEEAERIHNRRQGQMEGNNVPCTMCGSACVYIMLPQQRQHQQQQGREGEEKKVGNDINNQKDQNKELINNA